MPPLYPSPMTFSCCRGHPKTTPTPSARNSRNYGRGRAAAAAVAAAVAPVAPVAPAVRGAQGAREVAVLRVHRQVGQGHRVRQARPARLGAHQALHQARRVRVADLQAPLQDHQAHQVLQVRGKNDSISFFNRVTRILTRFHQARLIGVFIRVSIQRRPPCVADFINSVSIV